MSKAARSVPPVSPAAPSLLVVPPASPASPEVRRVSLADRVARAFPPLACVRGFRYFSRRRVELSSVSAHGLEADVKGTRTQHVRLHTDEGRLGSACSCAAKVLGPAACRHVWATLLEIDRQGLLASLRTTQRPLALGALEAPRPKPAPKPAPAASAARTRTRARPKVAP